MYQPCSSRSLYIFKRLSESSVIATVSAVRYGMLKYLHEMRVQISRVIRGKMQTWMRDSRFQVQHGGVSSRWPFSRMIMTAQTIPREFNKNSLPLGFGSIPFLLHDQNFRMECDLAGRTHLPKFPKNTGLLERIPISLRKRSVDTKNAKS